MVCQIVPLFVYYRETRQGRIFADAPYVDFVDDSVIPGRIGVGVECGE